MKTILLITRNAEDLITLSTLLAGKREYCVIAKQSGASAFSVLQEGVRVDLVISDYTLPDMDTVNFFNALKQTTGDPPPVIFLGDQVNVHDYLKSLSLGAFDFLFRPVQAREFLRIVNFAIRNREDKKITAGKFQQEKQPTSRGRTVPPTVFKEDDAGSARFSAFD